MGAFFLETTEWDALEELCDWYFAAEDLFMSLWTGIQKSDPALVQHLRIAIFDSDNNLLTMMPFEVSDSVVFADRPYYFDDCTWSPELSQRTIDRRLERYTGKHDYVFYWDGEQMNR